MSVIAHPQVPWVKCQQVSPGVFQCRCDVCGTMGGGPTPQADAFAAGHREHRAPSTHYGLGDLVARATKAVGIEPCTPCEARRRAMNGWFRR